MLTELYPLQRSKTPYQKYEGGDSTLLKAPELKSHHQMQFCVIPREGELYSSAEDTVSIFYTVSTEQMQQGLIYCKTNHFLLLLPDHHFMIVCKQNGSKI